MLKHIDGMADVIDAKEFATAFASAVTEESVGKNNFIARDGPESIYSLLQRVFPQVRSHSDDEMNDTSLDY